MWWRVLGGLVFLFTVPLYAGAVRDSILVKPDGRFEVGMPGNPSIDIVDMPDGSRVKTYQCGFPNVVYGLVLVDFKVKPDSPEPEPREVLDYAMQRFLKIFQCTPIKSDSIKINDKYPGIEFEARMTTRRGIARARIFQLKDRQYQLAVMGSEEVVTSKTADKFFASFKILEK